MRWAWKAPQYLLMHISIMTLKGSYNVIISIMLYISLALSSGWVLKYIIQFIFLRTAPFSQNLDLTSPKYLFLSWIFVSNIINKNILYLLSASSSAFLRSGISYGPRPTELWKCRSHVTECILSHYKIITPLALYVTRRIINN